MINKLSKSIGSLSNIPKMQMEHTQNGIQMLLLTIQINNLIGQLDLKLFS